MSARLVVRQGGAGVVLELCLQAPEFGGASVTIPLKEAVAPLMAALTPSAQRIGAVNTIIKATDGTLVGHNTDWCVCMAAARVHAG